MNVNEMINIIDTFPKSVKEKIYRDTINAKMLYKMISHIDLNDKSETVNIITKILSNPIVKQYLLNNDVKFKNACNVFNIDISENIDFWEFAKVWLSIQNS